jgi:hypothetical protein
MAAAPPTAATEDKLLPMSLPVIVSGHDFRRGLDHPTIPQCLWVAVRNRDPPILRFFCKDPPWTRFKLVSRQSQEANGRCVRHHVEQMIDSLLRGSPPTVMNLSRASLDDYKERIQR